MVKKILIVFVLVFFSGGMALLRAQCYAVVHLDSYVDSGGATGSTFTITTAYPNELILIGYDGWDTPGVGPVNVDGNSATHINTAHTGNSAVAEVYCYSAPLAGVHTIACTESGYTSPYYLNFAASFYATGSCTPLSCSDLITTETSVGLTSHFDTDMITTTTPNVMIFCTAVYNTGVFPGNRLHLRGVTTLDTMHKGNGIDASDADTVATVAGTYTVTSSDINSCCGGEIILVGIVPPLCGSTYTVRDSVVNANCLNDSGKAIITVSGGVGPFTYSWSPVGGTADSATGLSAGTYTVAIADADGCTASASITITEPTAIYTTVSSVPADSACAGQNITLNASGATNYLWSTGATGSSITVVVPAGDTAYYGVKGMTGACSDSIPFKIKIIPKIVASINASHDTICPHGSTTLIASGSGGQVTYKWNTGATTSSIPVTDTVNTKYIVTVYGICDSVKDTITVIVSPLPKPVISGTRSKCPGSTDTLSVSGGASYKWADGSTSNKYITGSINADSTITVVAYNSQGCSDTAHFTINVSPLPVVTITDTNTCLNNPVTIHASASGVGTFTYLWSPGGETNSSITVRDTDKTYTVTVSGQCKATRAITLKPVIANMTACCNTTILLGNDTVITASGVKKYLWSPAGSLNCDTCATVVATPNTTTTYTVIGTDSLGCQTETVITIIVEEPCTNFTVPNVFTPNNAGPYGENNVFYIKTEYLSAWSIVIFDRWGKEIYKSSNPQQYWDGKTEGGGEAPSGVYYYIINATCQGTTYKKDGFVQLIR